MPVAMGLLSVLFVLAGCGGSSGNMTTSSTLAISTSSLANGQVGTAYSATLAATGGTAPYTWSLTSGTLPAGLKLNTSTGAITGTPTATASAVALTFTVTDSSSPAQSKSVSLSLTIAGPAPLSITTTSLPNGQVGTAYSVTLAATGGTTPYAWTLTGGALPAGLTLAPATGAISGTPTATANATSLTFAVTDSSTPAQNQSVTLSLTVNSSGTAATCGETSQTGTDSGNALGQLGTPCVTGTNTAGYTVSSISYWVGSPTSTSFDLGVYSDSSGTPNTLLCSVSTGTITPSSGWNTIGISGCPALTANTPYWVGYITGSGSIQQGIVSGACPGTSSSYSVWANSDQSGVSLSNPFGSSAPDTGYCYSLYMTLNTVTSSGSITVSISPQQTGITINQTLSLTATTTDSAGVNWSVNGSGCSGTACGAFSSATSLTGVAVTYTPPSTAGVYTITASSVTTISITATATVGVTDLAGMTTYHNDLYRDGANTQEYALTPSNVTTSTFGKLFSCSVDESVYAQPLWVPNLTVNGAVHNVVFVATQNDSLYAFDADSNTTPCTPLWHVNLLDSAHGGTSGETAVPSGLPGYLVGAGGGDIQPLVGVTGTQVIDPTTNTLYVVSKSVIASGPTFFQRLHAIDLATGNENFSGPATIAATYPGTGDGTSTTTFVPQLENQRPGLALVNGTVYIAWASHEDVPVYPVVPPFYGWIIGYNASNLAQTSVFNVDPNVPSSPLTEGVGDGGIWMSGGAPAADSSGNLYFISANGAFDPTTSNYGDTLMQLSPSLVFSNNYFTPSDQLTDDEGDVDFGSGGAVLVDLPANGGNPTHLIIGGGKDSALYVLNRDAMGGYGDSNAWQKMYINLNNPGFHGIFATGAFWNSTLYISTFNGPLQALSLNPSTAYLTQLPNVGPETFAKYGPTPSVSSTPNDSNGIVWLIDATQFCIPTSPGCGPAVLRAYNASNLASEIWNSSQVSGDAAGNAVKFTVPTVANGKVYVGTRGNNTGGADNSTTIPGELDVYGLLPN